MSKIAPLKIYDINDMNCIKTFESVITYNAVQMKLLSDDFLLILYEHTDPDDVLNYEIFSCRIWDLKEDKLVKFFKGYRYKGSFYAVRMLPSRKLIICTEQFVRVLSV
jgi:hypothetical protein